MVHYEVKQKKAVIANLAAPLTPLCGTPVGNHCLPPSPPPTVCEIIEFFKEWFWNFFHETLWISSTSLLVEKPCEKKIKNWSSIIKVKACSQPDVHNFNRNLRWKSLVKVLWPNKEESLYVYKIPFSWTSCLFIQ